MRSSDQTSEETVGALVHRLSEQILQLVRSEIRLAQAELTEKGKHAGIGPGMFSAAGVGALLGKSKVQASTAPKPELAIDGIRRDVAVMKGARS